MKNLTNLVAAAVALTIVSACGGGGSSSAPVASSPSPAAAPSPSPAPTATTPDLVLSVAASTYPPASVEKGAWDLLMSQRSACGFGLLQQDTRLDAASASHSHYLVQNSLDKLLTVIGHGEDSTWANFTGGNPFDRVAHAGYPTFSPSLGVTEILTNFFSFVPQGQAAPLVLSEATGAAQMRGLLETVYHLAGAMNAGRAGGVGMSNGTGPSNSGAYFQQQFRLVADFAVASDNLQRLGSSTVATWPCAGLSGVAGAFKPTTESPNPFPDVTDSAVTYGTPIYFKADAGSKLVVSAATVTKVSDSSVLALRQLTSATDAAGEIGANEVFLVSTTALAAGSSYSVSASGTLNGAAFTKAFMFSTAP